ncbi:LysR family transcriptional regulator [Alsobacter sp. SYSU M60028]|uniref:LysR family transcriptional regulator n=1 Tax=Alsobacter ponti TaxID=2962936 RepID=A0ABT1LEV2_9HYPH|nr:LysR family transcriptional regulator [Alsobacter ponti]MCP8939643.1 LysR family transcriptional regulator [Alsobacter ponti]
MLDRLTGMQVFVKVAALGSLSAAARALGMSQTMATKHIAALEDRLGVKLLHRTTRRLTLTEAGRRYLERAERILGEVAEADEAAAADRVEVRGVLRVAAPLSFGVREIAPRMAAFALRHPGVVVDLGLSDRFVDLLEEGWDLAIRIGRMQDSSMTARRIAPCRLLLAASDAYLAAHGAPRRVADLAAHNCLSYTLSRMLSPNRWLFGRDGHASVAVTGNLKANNGDALLAAALAGQGVIYEPTFLVGDAVRAGLLRPIALDEPPVELPGIYAVHPASRLAPARVRAFIDFLAEAYRPLPPWDRGLGLDPE